MTQPSLVIKAIIAAIETNDGTVLGTETLALEVGAAKHYVIKCARVIQHNNLITIIPSSGGRGRKTIYKRNRNQPGSPRKR